MRIGKDVLERAVKRFVDMEDLEVELLGHTVRLIMKVKALLMRIPVSIALVFRGGQENPEDPIRFEIQASSLVKSALKGFKGNAVVLNKDELLIYPSKLFPFMMKFTVETISFEDDHVLIKLRPHGW